jgi:hypothetical protein
MTDRTLERLGAACGIPAVVLSPVGFALIGAAGFGGDPTTPREDIARAVARGSGEQVLAGAMVDTLGAVFFVIFAARLWATLRRAEGEPGWLSLACFAGALMAIGASFVDKSAFFALGFKLGHGLSTDEAVLLTDISAGSFLIAQAFMGVLLAGAAAVVSLRWRALPVWLGWSAAGIAVANLIGVPLGPEIGFVAFMGFLAWMLATSFYLTLRPARAVIDRASSSSVGVGF